MRYYTAKILPHALLSFFYVAIAHKCYLIKIWVLGMVFYVYYSMQNIFAGWYFCQYCIVFLGILGWVQLYLVAYVLKKRTHAPTFYHYCCCIPLADTISDRAKKYFVGNLLVGSMSLCTVAFSVTNPNRQEQQMKCLIYYILYRLCHGKVLQPRYLADIAVPRYCNVVWALLHCRIFRCIPAYPTSCCCRLARYMSLLRWVEVDGWHSRSAAWYALCLRWALVCCDNKVFSHSMEIHRPMEFRRAVFWW